MKHVFVIRILLFFMFAILLFFNSIQAQNIGDRKTTNLKFLKLVWGDGQPFGLFKDLITGEEFHLELNSHDPEVKDAYNKILLDCSENDNCKTIGQIYNLKQEFKLQHELEYSDKDKSWIESSRTFKIWVVTSMQKVKH